MRKFLIHFYVPNMPLRILGPAISILRHDYMTCSSITKGHECPVEGQCSHLISSFSSNGSLNIVSTTMETFLLCSQFPSNFDFFLFQLFSLFFTQISAKFHLKSNEIVKH